VADNRIILLDALRGACFVVMTVDHLPGNPLHRFSNPNFGPLGFFTAALGFVFLSGLVAGLVYERERILGGTRSMVRRVLRRARALYLTQMLMFLLVVGAVELHLRGASRWHLDLFNTAPWKGFAFSATLLYEPDYFGILPMYFLFLLLTPVVLWQFGIGNARQVLAVSALLWAASGLMIRLPENPEGVDFGAFNPIGYQFLFLVGLAFGTGHLSIERLPANARKWLIASAFVVAALFLVLRVQYALGGPANALVESISSGYSVEQLGPLRLLNFAAFGLVLYWIASKTRWTDAPGLVFSWLAFVGRHSLPVFAWSILATYAATALMPLHVSSTVGLLAVVLVIASLTLPAQLHAMVRRRQGRLTSRRVLVDEPVIAGIGGPVDLAAAAPSSAVR